jgi:hypothetical protein
MKKILFLLVLVVVAGAAAALFLVKRQIDLDTDEITSLDKVKVSADEVKKLATEKAKDLRTVLAAAEQTAQMAVDEKLEMWKTQLANESAAIRMKAARELMKMQEEAGSKVGRLLEEISTDKNQDHELRLMVQKELAQKELRGKAGKELVAAAGKLAGDQRPGVRLAALEALAQEGSAEALALVGKAAESDPDEDVAMMAAMLLEEAAEKGKKGEK